MSETIQTNKPENLPKAVFAGGCFWCVESEFRSIQGVVYTLSGYTGGETENPTYRDITTGRTGHAEATEIYYNPEIVSYEELLKYFFTTAHDPTQLNRQGVDVGTQYRSAIFYQDEEEKAKAQKAIDEINSRKVWKKPIVTTLEPLDIFYPAEEYHQQYYEKYERANGKPHIRMIYKMKKKALSE
ncbi:MAG: peptide-methionine (S)-S-oxide reductase MsrA [Pseudomonadota bacterium]